MGEISNQATDDKPIERSVGRHRPLHLYADQGCYWITAATIQHTPFFQASRHKEIFVSEMEAAAEAYQVEVAAWTLMDHHYHAIVYPKVGKVLPRYIGRLHMRTAKLINGVDDVPGRVVWYQYWDRFLRTEGDFWSRINYMWWNPVKHGFCVAPEEWLWNNLSGLMTNPDNEVKVALARFPAPRKLPGDEW